MTVDLSGAVAAILRGYGGVLAGYRGQAAGDPAGLRASSQRCLAHADSVATTGTAVGDRSGGLGWTGTAADGFRAAAGTTGTDLSGVATTLRRNAGALDSAAGSLQAATGALDAVRVDFQARGNVLCANASAVPAGQAGAVLSAARSLGESAAGAAAEVIDKLTGELAALASGLAAGGLPAGGLAGYRATEGGVAT